MTPKSPHHPEHLRAEPDGLNVIKVQDVATALVLLLAETYGLYFKTRNIHKILSETGIGTHHPFLNNHGPEIFLTATMLAESVQKFGGTLHRWPAMLDQLQKSSSSAFAYSLPCNLLAELLQQNIKLALQMRETLWLCDEYGDTETAILLGGCIEETDQRVTILARSRP